ncbi:ATPase [Aquimarina sp. AD1]|uniref:ATP cone domain-containing protein n=1 Tax=Aquimarina sp. (strain AD1) TaxID=1714848 RepID=UPI000E5220E8|nr:ATP cone domain-containing protein [Aquimarina sp. AD1]AXT58151.1 ATPase [Aquimarina sp. AD1]RKN05327.1 ATPase [Aquimarina sp. AD1]
MKNEDFNIRKSSGKKVKFSLSKLKSSLSRSGADNKTIKHIVDTVKDELYQGISTKEIYNRAFSLLKKEKTVFASKYKLKKAIYELGPTGFPFERFVAAVLKFSGYQVQVGQIVSGKCVTHEVDIIAKKNSDFIIIECKFHSEEGRNCNVKIPLYIYSRYQDIIAHFGDKEKDPLIPNQGWVVTNTRFTKDAIQYGSCIGLHLLSWDYPNGNGLKDRVDHLGLYPITVSTILTNREKQFLLSRDVVLYQQLKGDVFYLDHLGISENRKQKILNEIKMLCDL